MQKNRLEAFSDGVLAIIITIMVLEMKVPHGDDWHALLKVYPVFLSYILSFTFIAIYWNNHHHLMHAVEHINGRALWANMHLLFWLSLIPFTSGWMGENNFTTAPVVAYGVVLFMCAIAYYLLTRTLLHLHEKDSMLVTALGEDKKGRLSLAIYLSGVIMAFFIPWISMILYAIVAVMWFIPERRIEKKIKEEEEKEQNEQGKN